MNQYMDSALNQGSTGAAYAAPRAGNADNELLDFEDVISNEEEFLILPEGDYLFKVAEVVRGWHEDSPGMKACNMVTLKLEIATPEGIARARVNLFLVRRWESRICGFFRCISEKKRGVPIKMDWPRAEGATGYAHFAPTVYKGREYNEVVRFLDECPANAGTASGPAMVMGQNPGTASGAAMGMGQNPGMAPGPAMGMGQNPGLAPMAAMGARPPAGFTDVSGTIPIPY